MKKLSTDLSFTFSTVLIAIGIPMMILMIIFEDETGGIPVLLIATGIIIKAVNRFKII